MWYAAGEKRASSHPKHHASPHPEDSAYGYGFFKVIKASFGSIGAQFYRASTHSPPEDHDSLPASPRPSFDALEAPLEHGNPLTLEQLRLFGGICESCTCNRLACDSAGAACFRNGANFHITSSAFTTFDDELGKPEPGRGSPVDTQNFLGISREMRDVMYVARSAKRLSPLFGSLLVVLAIAGDSQLVVLNLTSKMIGVLRRSDLSIVERLTNGHASLNLDQMYIKNVSSIVDGFYDPALDNKPRKQVNPRQARIAMSCFLKDVPEAPRRNVSMWTDSGLPRYLGAFQAPPSAFASLEAMLKRLPALILHHMGSKALDNFETLPEIHSKPSGDGNDLQDLPAIELFLESDPWLKQLYYAACRRDRWIRLEPSQKLLKPTIHYPQSRLEIGKKSGSIAILQSRIGAREGSSGRAAQEWMLSSDMRDFIPFLLTALISGHADRVSGKVATARHALENFKSLIRMAADSSTTPSTSGPRARIGFRGSSRANARRPRRTHQGSNPNEGDGEDDGNDPRHNNKRFFELPEDPNGCLVCPVHAGDQRSHPGCRRLLFDNFKKLKNVSVGPVSENPLLITANRNTSKAISRSRRIS